MANGNSFGTPPKNSKVKPGGQEVDPGVQAAIDAITGRDLFSAANNRKRFENEQRLAPTGLSPQQRADAVRSLQAQQQQSQGQTSSGPRSGSSIGGLGGGVGQLGFSASPNILRQRDIQTQLAELQLRNAQSQRANQRFAQNKAASKLPGPRHGVFQPQSTGNSLLDQLQQVLNPAPSPQRTSTSPIRNETPVDNSRVRVDVQEGTRRSSNPDALALLERLIGRGGSDAAKQSSKNQQKSQTALLRSLMGLGGLASGNAFSQPILAGIRRQVMDEVISRINRQSEAGGSSKSALAQTLRNDALARMEEAQSRVALDAQLQAAQQQANLGNTINTIGTQDPLQAELLSLLQAGANLDVDSPFSDSRFSFEG